VARHRFEWWIVWWFVLETAALAADRSATYVRFDVTDPRETITREIDSTLQLRVVRIPHSHVAHFGWEVQVLERDAGSSPNVLRRGVSPGGPHPSDILAWLSRDRYFPDDRRLPLPGHPYEFRIRLIDCHTERTGDDVGFVSGSVEILWRRLDSAGGAELRAG
jgi:hypothetical protein